MSSKKLVVFTAVLLVGTAIPSRAQPCVTDTILITQGLNLIANQLNHKNLGGDYDNHACEVLQPLTQYGTPFTVFTYDETVGNYMIQSWDPDAGWSSCPGLNLTNGVGFYLDWAGPNVSLTFTGDPVTFHLLPPSPGPSFPVSSAAGFHVLGRQDKGIGTFESMIGNPPGNCGPVEVYRLDKTGLSQFKLNDVPVIPYFYLNGAWVPEPPRLDCFEGCVMRFGTACSGIVPTCFVSAIVPIAGCKSPPPSFLDLTNYGMGFVAGDTIKLVKSSAMPCGMGPGSVIGPMTASVDVPGFSMWIDLTLASGFNSATPGNTYDVVVQHAGGSPCGCLEDAFTFNASCNACHLDVHLVGPVKLAPGQKNFYMLYYKNFGKLCTETFQVNNIPNASCVTVSDFAPGLNTAGSPGLCGTTQRLTYGPIAVPAGATGSLVFALTTTLPVGTILTLNASSGPPCSDSDTLSITVGP